MELAKTVAEWRSRPPEQWLAEINRVLPPVVVILLVVLFAFKGAGLTWRLLEQPAVQDLLPPIVPAADGGAPTASIDLSSLRDWRPFGEEPAPGEAETLALPDLDTPLTSLPLTLTGLLVAHSLPEPGEVIVVPESGVASMVYGRSTARTYHVGEAVEDANGNSTGYTVHSVFVDRVMLESPRGSLERLSWPEADQAAQSTGRINSTLQSRAPTPFRAEAASNAAAAAFVADAAVAAASTAFAQHIQLRMHEEQGQMIGFRLEPRNDSPVLSQLGLEPGDVLTEVNGTRLNDLRNTAAVLQALGETPQASVVIRRNGVDQPQVINVGDIQRLAESLQ